MGQSKTGKSVEFSLLASFHGEEAQAPFSRLWLML
jgi:hypothetical protein